MLTVLLKEGMESLNFLRENVRKKFKNKTFISVFRLSIEYQEMEGGYKVCATFALKDHILEEVICVGFDSFSVRQQLTTKAGE